MLDLLLKVAVGVVAGAVAVGVACAVYKRVTKEAVVKEASEKLKENNIFQKNLKAKIKEVEREKGTVTFDILDSFDSPILENKKAHGEEISSDIYKGQEILLDIA